MRMVEAGKGPMRRLSLKPRPRRREKMIHHEACIAVYVYALGKTDEGRFLHITFTLRAVGAKIRVISARDMSRQERKTYEQTI